jgi:hypothetical protein
MRLHEDKKRLDQSEDQEYKIVLIENFPCKSKAELTAREYEVKAAMPQEQLINPEKRKKCGRNNAVENRFNIIDDEKEQRFRIRWNDAEGKHGENWSYKITPKAEAQAGAEEFRRDMIASLKALE